MYGCGKDCLSLIPFTLPQINCFTLSLKCFFSDSDNCPDVGIGPLHQFLHPPRAGPVLLTLLFFPPYFLSPTKFRVILYNSFPLVRYSCPLSAGVLHGLLCPNAYSWCIRGERHTPHSPTPLPYCSSAGIFNVDNLYLVFCVFPPFVYSLYLRFIEVWLWYTYVWFLYLPSFGVTGLLGSVISHFSPNLGNWKANIS